ncbi:MAG TPA: ATP-binding protein, partial [Burkholderiaceae bacterium]
LERRVPGIASHAGDAQGRRGPRRALVFPLRWADDKPPAGALVAGLNPLRPLDGDYRGFVRLVAQQVGASLAQARALQLEREQRERLAELDRAKTEFFANVSHEFRTPLTLLLSPLDELQRRSNELPAGLATEIDVAARNSRRLLQLVDDLLDFSQIEQRRQRAVLQPTDLASLTTDVASVFRSAIERAGLAMRLECADDLPLVPVDRDMWDKIVSNLLSNALKFTFDGAITVRLGARSLHVELVVSDTGVGIPKGELPNLFKRFHRVRGARARTIEGSGIGLALVHDLVSRMGGQVQVRSIEGHGTDFTVWLPLKPFRRTMDAVADDATDARAAPIAAGLAGEAGNWGDERVPRDMVDDPLGAPKGGRLRPAPGAHVLVADDNADLRDYLRRLLGAYWTVTLAADGAQAIREARSQSPDLILADVMMPNVDGFALLRAVRGDAALKDTPVIFLTARAGEDAAIEGLLAGADDYLAKPFSARELIARVGGQIELSRARRRTEELNALLVRFSDAVRGARGPAAVAETACRLVAEHLRVERACWAEIDWTARDYVIGAAFERAGVPAVAGRFGLDAWEPFTTSLLEGKPVVVDDTQSDPRVPSLIREGYARLGVGADVAMPVLVNGRFVSLLAVNQRETRRWSAEELALVAGIAGRCWSEVERARGAAALRESEAHLAEELEDARVLQKMSNQLVSEAGPNGHYN